MAVVTLVAAAGVAAADDTIVNLGYDEENQVFLFNTSSSHSPYDCTLQNGPVAVTYMETEDGSITVDALEAEGEGGVLEPFLFPNRDAEDVDLDEYTPADEPIGYTGVDGECALAAGAVAGPNGQINHGQVMKALHGLIDMKGHGCINRVIAQSDLGKGDQQLKTSDVDPEFTMGEGGTIDFMTLATACDQGNKEKGEDHPGYKGDDHPSHKAQKGSADAKPGKAKGRNK